MHVSMLRDFTAWAASHWKQFLLEEPPDDAAVALEELLLNVWISLTNATVIDVPH
jgi:hypothetical protein